MLSCISYPLCSVRHICHDWPDTEAVKILKNLREAAQPYTRLVLHDMIMQHACADSDAEDIPVQGGLPPPPSPLLANWGRANAFSYTMDMQVRRPMYAFKCDAHCANIDDDRLPLEGAHFGRMARATGAERMETHTYQARQSTHGHL